MLETLMSNYNVLYGVIITLLVVLIFVAFRKQPKSLTLTDRLREKASERIQRLLDLERGAFLYEMEKIYDKYRQALEAEKEDPIDKL